LINEDSFKQVLDLDGWREGMLFSWVSRGKSVGGIGLYSRRRGMDNRRPGNTIRTEAGITRQKMRAGAFRQLKPLDGRHLIFRQSSGPNVTNPPKQ
jgi:hypothetical protein